MKYRDFKKLSNVDMKQIMGGSAQLGGGTCTETSQCPSGAHCVGLGNLPKVCVAVSQGTACSSDSDCGNGQSCVTNNTGGSPAKWCSITGAA